MSFKNSAASSETHPPVGTYIDNGALELIEVLGVGGYGVVYKAIDTKTGQYYAVKCLVAQSHQSVRQRQIHIREIALHQIASPHPNVITLHRVIEEYNRTYIVMDFAPDHDLFTQILHRCRYLGDDDLIKHVFLQLLDAVEYCHGLGIYHRDLKPENILCFNDGLRVAITDFGLATTDKLSEEFRTGSVYHMSPECQGGEFAPTGNYSPMFNDIWSLGIILLNLATGRNPWKSATPDDATFQAYLRDPVGFLPSVLPISSELNEVLIRMLEVDWRERMTLRELRRAIEEVNSFYSMDAVFEGSMARCPWESSMDIDDSDSSSDDTKEDSPIPDSPLVKSADDRLRFSTCWSGDSESEILFAKNPGYSAEDDSSYDISWDQLSSGRGTWAYEAQLDELLDRPLTPLSRASSGAPSLPPTPNNFDVFPENRGTRAQRKGLTINTDLPSQLRFYNPDATLDGNYSPTTSIMQTAIENDMYPSSFFFTSAVSDTKTSLAGLHVPMDTPMNDKEMGSPTFCHWDIDGSDISDISSPSIYSSVDSEDMAFTRSQTPSPAEWSGYETKVQCQTPHSSQPTSSCFTSMTNVAPSKRFAFNNFTTSKPTGVSKPRRHTVFNPFKLLPRSLPPSPPTSPPPATATAHAHFTSTSGSASPGYQTLHTAPFSSPWNSPSTQERTCAPEEIFHFSPQAERPSHVRSTRWFNPGKFLAYAGAQ